MSNFHTLKFKRTRKEHRCWRCKGPITKGQTYKRVSGKYDSLMYGLAECLDCYKEALVAADTLTR